MGKFKLLSYKYVASLPALRLTLLRLRGLPRRIKIIAVVLLLVAAELLAMFQPWLTPRSYALGSAGALLGPANQQMADMLKLDLTTQQYNFNGGLSGTTPSSVEPGKSATDKQVSASAYQDATKGISVLDPTNKVQMTLKPKFGLAPGKQDSNRIVYPLTSGKGWAVYSMHGIGVKEDIILNQLSDNAMSFEFELQLGDGQAAKLEADGGIGVYGSKLFSGEISAGSDKDAALLAKARQNAPKDTLLFKIPKPVIVESYQHKSAAKAHYVLSGSTVRVEASQLDKARYPLSIDPSIYVATAQQFMNGNNETNIDFNVADKLIQKGKTTGARFDAWTNTTNLPTTSWGAGSVAAGGYIYSVGGNQFTGQVFSSQGAGSYTVPSGVTSLTFKIWGGGGGGGAGGTAGGGVGGAGGAGGYVTGTVTVTPGESLSIYVGGKGGAGPINTSGGGGGAGAYSSLYRSSTALAVAGGGGGGGGGRTATNTHTGGAGGAGGGTSGVTGSNAGSSSGTVTGGVGGSSSAGGAAGTGGNNIGANGGTLDGAAGGDGRTGSGNDGSGGSGGDNGGGNGGASINANRAGGGGGASGWYGGGGGSGSTATTGGSGGGGGSSYTISGATGVTNTAGSGVTPANSSDSSRNGAAIGGTAGAAGAVGGDGSNGIVVLTYGSGTTSSPAVSFAQFNTSSGTIDSANPGSSACSGWCTTSAYNLPSGRSNFSLVTYNGFLYAIGGENSGGTRQNTVYISKLGANGEPRLWHPTDSNQANWVYWYSDTALSSIRSLGGAVAYNNRMYLLGGIGATAPVSSVEIANINPTGTLGSWSTSTALPVNLYGQGVQIYNDRIYTLGGASTVGGAPLNSVYYNKINADGSLNAWTTTTGFTTARMSGGGNFTSVWGAYMYVSGGCSAVNGSGYCSGTLADTQVASINTDGSLDVWNNVGGVSSSRIGHNLIAWRNYIYEIGGCSSQNTTSGDCNNNMLNSIIYGAINQDGDASTVGQSVASGTAPCSGTTPTGCNLPGTANIGNMLNSAIITNGYLYVIGGCTNNACSTTNGNVAYVAISSTGTIAKPATCPSGAYQGSAWCVDTVHTISGGIASASPVVFANRIYLVGGLDGGSNTNSIYYSTLNNDGSIGAWTAQTMTGVGANSVSYFYAYARANPASANTNPGNLYIFGGCATSSAAGCTAYSQNVYKCNIQIAGAIQGCSTTNQLQIGTVPGDTATGLGIMSGTVYANYIYLIGGVSPNQTDLASVRYAKFNNSNNVVAASGTTWVQSGNTMATGRRRAAAFGYNGYIYVVGGYEGTGGILADIEFIKVNVSDGSLGSASDTFHVSSVTINQRWGLSVPVSNSFAYVIGGCSVGASPSGCTARTDVIQTFQIYNNDSGAPAGFTTSANTYNVAPNRIGANAAVLNGYLYLAGGCTSTTDCTNAISDVSYAQLSVNGAVGSWAGATNGLPAVRTWGKLVAAGGSLYYIGGQSSTATDERAEVYYATPVSGNITSSWGTASNGLPAAKTRFGATVWNNRIYVVGGKDVSNAVTNTVYVSPQLNSGGNITSAWTSTSTAFNIARSGVTAIAYANNLYIMGGYDGTNYLIDAQYSQINASSGLAGAWTYTASLPQALSDADGFAANGYIYLLGGRSADTVCDPIALTAPISANTTIASGNNPTGIGEWYETNQRFTGARYGGAAAYYDGKAYILGGACGSTLTYGSPTVQQTTLLSQPQVARYSIAIDTDSDVYPTKWLLNGVDNSIGAKWQLKYRSMTNTTTSCTSPAMTTWGKETVFGDVTLGLPGLYTPKDGSGTSTNCARFYYFNVGVDSSQAFGYPDDVSRGPTITDLTLQFTADPSKRLMHGRTFTGGLQMPDDTPIYSN